MFGKIVMNVPADAFEHALDAAKERKFEGATDTVAMQTYAEEVLAPLLQAGDVVIWDNLQPHKNAHVIHAIEAVGARVIPLPQ